jgi:O-acetylserine/cysteine efflux transporter
MALRDFCLGVLITLIWGGSYVIANSFLQNSPPFFISFSRSFIVFIVLFPFAKKLETSISEMLLLSFYLGILHQACWIVAISLGININFSILIMQLVVPITVILGHFILDEKLHKKHIIGILIAFSGLVIVIANNLALSLNFAALVALISAFGNALFNIKVKRVKNSDMLNFLCYFSLSTAFLSFICMMIFDNITFDRIIDIDGKVIKGILYLSFSSVFASGLWYYLLRKYKVALVLPFQLLVPVFGFLLNYIFLNSHIDISLLFGGFVILIGIMYLYKINDSKDAESLIQKQE